MLAVIAIKIQKEKTGDHKLDYGINKKNYDDYKARHPWLTMSQIWYTLQQYSLPNNGNLDPSINNNNKLTNDISSSNKRSIVEVSIDITNIVISYLPQPF